MLTKLTGNHKSPSARPVFSADRGDTGRCRDRTAARVRAEREPTLQRVLPSDVAITLEFSACLAPRRLRRPAAATVLQAIREMVADRQSELMPQW